MPESPVRSRTVSEIDKLLQLHPKGYDLSLDRVSALLKRLGNPQDNIAPAIHIAGTNGKGSATAFCRAALEAAGLRVHTHTSPHLVNWNERFRLAEEPGVSKNADDDVLADAIARVGRANNGEEITVFEILTAVMFMLFADHPADACVIEVGLGGRFDATNVIKTPAASLIMPVTMDHEQWLGDTPAKIAFEKAGIIKRDCPVVIGSQPFQDAEDVLIRQANRNGMQPLVYGQDFFAREENGRMVMQLPDGLWDLPLPALAGRHQIANAAAALMAVREAGFPINDGTAEEALKDVVWPGRLQKLPNGVLHGLAPADTEIWIDGGHNADAGKAAAEFLADRDDLIERPLFLISGMLDTKDPQTYFANFVGMTRHVFTVPLQSTGSGISSDLLAAKIAETGLSAEPVQSVASALSLLGDTWEPPEVSPRIMICGSLYLVGDVLRENGTPPK
ncbi:MAG: folylpolyglutamate synthase/dihydrofolate synthase family protein [Pseudomonadota bacterium]